MRHICLFSFAAAKLLANGMVDLDHFCCSQLMVGEIAAACLVAVVYVGFVGSYMWGLEAMWLRRRVE